MTCGKMGEPVEPFHKLRLNMDSKKTVCGFAFPRKDSRLKAIP